MADIDIDFQELQSLIGKLKTHFVVSIITCFIVVSIPIGLKNKKNPLHLKFSKPYMEKLPV